EPAQVLTRLAAAGAVAVGLHETTLGDAAAAGRIFVVPRAMLDQLDAPVLAHLPGFLSPHDLILGWRRAGVDPWLEAALTAALPRVAQRVSEPGGADYVVWRLVEQRRWQDVSLGFDPGVIAAIESAGMGVVPRFRPDGLVPAPPIGARVAQILEAFHQGPGEQGLGGQGPWEQK